VSKHGIASTTSIASCMQAFCAHGSPLVPKRWAIGPTRYRRSGRRDCKDRCRRCRCRRGPIGSPAEPQGHPSRHAPRQLPAGEMALTTAYIEKERKTSSLWWQETVTSVATDVRWNLNVSSAALCDKSTMDGSGKNVRPQPSAGTNTIFTACQWQQ
jgi:hypothetical protein